MKTTRRLAILAHAAPSKIGRLIGADADTGTTIYQVDGPYRDGYRVLGMKEGITGVGYLKEARELMRRDFRAHHAAA